MPPYEPRGFTFIGFPVTASLLFTTLCITVDRRERLRDNGRSSSTSDFFAQWNDVVDAVEDSDLESPPDSPSASMAHSPSPGNYPDAECIDIQEACQSFHKSVGDGIKQLNDQTNNKYQFSPPPTPPNFLLGVDSDSHEEDPSAEPSDEPPSPKPDDDVTTTRMFMRAFPYMLVFFLLQVSFFYFSATSEGMVILVILLSLIGMALVPVIFLARNFSFVFDYFMSGGN